jgi:hypothetical protein
VPERTALLKMKHSVVNGFHHFGDRRVSLFELKAHATFGDARPAITASDELCRRLRDFLELVADGILDEGVDRPDAFGSASWQGVHPDMANDRLNSLVVMFRKP